MKYCETCKYKEKDDEGLVYCSNDKSDQFWNDVENNSTCDRWEPSSAVKITIETVFEAIDELKKKISEEAGVTEEDIQEVKDKIQ